MNRAINQYNHLFECIILAMVVLASTSIGLDTKTINHEKSSEIDYIYGTVTLSTRTAMNALGLSEDTKIGAKATMNLTVNSIISEGCKDCIQIPAGLQMEGFVEIQNIRNDMGGLGRIEGILSITYLKEYLKENFISKEWFIINWNASGGTELDKFTQITIIHNPPKLELESRYDATFITSGQEKESRTGPWLLAKTLNGGSINAQGCFPNSISCEKSLNPDINLTSVEKSIDSPKTIPHPNSLIQINNVESTENIPSKVDGFRDLFEIKNETNNHNIWCNGNDENIIATKSWNIEMSNNNIIAPMTLWLDILNLPSSSFLQTKGIWSEIDYSNAGCASISDENKNLIFNIVII